MEITLEEAAHGKETQIRIPTLGHLRDLPRQRRQARHRARRSAPPATAPARCTCARASSASSRPARTATAPARSFPSPAPPASGQGRIKKQQDAGGEDPGRHQRGHAHPLERQRRAGHQRRPAGRPVHRDPHQAARDLRARRRRPALHGAGRADHRGARRRRSRCRRWAARPRSSCPKARSTARQFRLRGKGIKGVRSSYPGDLYCHVSGRDAGQAHRAPAQAAEGARRVVPQVAATAIRRTRKTLDRPGQGPVQGLSRAGCSGLRPHPRDPGLPTAADHVVAGADSLKSILYALGANFAIALAKTAGAVFTGSPSMLAEAIHSFADCANQALLLLGPEGGRAGPPRPSTRSAMAGRSTSGASSSP